MRRLNRVSFSLLSSLFVAYASPTNAAGNEAQQCYLDTYSYCQVAWQDDGYSSIDACFDSERRTCPKNPGGSEGGDPKYVCFTNPDHNRVCWYE